MSKGSFILEHVHVAPQVESVCCAVVMATFEDIGWSDKLLILSTPFS